MTDYIFYNQTDIPNKWTLPDILHWKAFQEIPATYYVLDKEGRESLDILQENLFSLGDFFGDVWFEKHETDRVGLSPDPRWILENEEEGEELILDSAQYERMAAYEFDDPVETKHHKEKYKMLALKAREVEARFAVWKVEFEDYLDRFKSKLIVDFREGRLVAKGIRVDGCLDGEFNEIVSDNFSNQINRQNYLEDAYMTIPANIWVSRRVDWSGGLIQADDHVYLGIVVLGVDALRLYPPKSSEITNVSVVGKSLVINSKSRAVNPSKSRKGRPEKKWAEIDVKIAEIISREAGLPRKQDALAQEIKDWYTQNHNQTIGLSTIKSRLQPYYENTNIQKSEK